VPNKFEPGEEVVYVDKDFTSLKYRCFKI